MSEIKLTPEGNYVIYLGSIDNEYIYSSLNIEEVKAELESFVSNSSSERRAEIEEFHISVDDVQLMHVMRTLVLQYYEFNGSGGVLHVQLDDNNYDFFKSGLDDATEKNDIMAILISQLGIKLGEHRVYVALNEPELVYKLIEDIYNYKLKKS